MIATSLIKQISSNDPTFARPLYQAPRKIEVLGKLMINTNYCPSISGADVACWDRMVIIPWDVRYVIDDSKVDVAEWRLPSDTAKVARISSLISAFGTVCLNEISKFYVGEGVHTTIPIPACVKVYTDKMREDSYPLITFIRKYMIETTDESKFVDATQASYSYNAYVQRMKKSAVHQASVDKFIEMLNKASISTIFNSAEDVMENFIDGYTLSADGEDLAAMEVSKMNSQLDIKSFFTKNKVSPIVAAFNRQAQQKRKLEHKDDEEYDCSPTY